MYIYIVIRSAVLTRLSTNVNEESGNNEKWKSSIGCGGVIVSVVLDLQRIEWIHEWICEHFYPFSSIDSIYQGM